MTPNPVAPLTEDEKRRGLTLAEKQRLAQPNPDPVNPGVVSSPPFSELTAEERGRLTPEEKAAGLTLEDKERNITVNEKRRRDELSQARYLNPDPQATIQLKAQHDWEHENHQRILHLEQNPQHRVIVDNNPVKVMVFVNSTSHSVPPGPLTVADFKRMTKITGERVAMNGRSLNDDAQELTLTGGEVFISGNNTR